MCHWIWTALHWNIIIILLNYLVESMLIWYLNFGAFVESVFFMGFFHVNKTIVNSPVFNFATIISPKTKYFHNNYLHHFSLCLLLVLFVLFVFFVLKWMLNSAGFVMQLIILNVYIIYVHTHTHHRKENCAIIENSIFLVRITWFFGFFSLLVSLGNKTSHQCVA